MVQCSLTNANIHGSIGDLKVVSIKDNTSFYNDVSISYSVVYGTTNVNFYGDVEVKPNGYFANYTREYGAINVYGDLINHGRVHWPDFGGLFQIHIKSNLLHNGTEWSASDTYIDGYNDQYILIPEDSAFTGRVRMVAALDGSTFQWQKNGVDIAGATGEQYVLSGIKTSNYGTYQCFVDGEPDREIFIGREVPPPFVIDDVFVCNLNESQTYVSWTTTEPTTGFIFYAKNDTTNGFPYEVWDTWEYEYEHSVIFNGLEKDSTYYFIIDAMDERVE